MEKPAYTLEFEKPLLELTRQLEALQHRSSENQIDLSKEITSMQAKLEATKRDVYSNLGPWQRVQIARHPKRPGSLAFISEIFENFQELHGDRQFGDDQALIGGTAFLDGRAVMVIAHEKGSDTKDKIARNFGMPQPEGYRKALRLMRTAEKFGLPVICFVDTKGAYPGINSEERHVSEAIAVNLREMTLLRVPTISVIISEGGSGGALGIGVTDRVLSFENSYYSVISPEGCAAILWKDAAEAPRAAAALKLDAGTLQEFGIVDELVDEPFGGAHNDPAEAAKTLHAALTRHLAELSKLGKEELLEKRYARYRKLGVYAERAQG
jgi:acetyl-CoA carboxylase carboxyl transferase subunit alpha